MRAAIWTWTLVLAVSLASVGAAQDRSGVRPEVLSGPTGPGSIEGLGEAFEPNPNTGTSSYSVGIGVPPGAGGFAPSLALGYSSGGGNAELGLGWNIGLPMVQRGTDRGLPAYDSGDVIVLRGMGGSGAEDLVSMPDGSYRFRVEGAFARGRQMADGSWLFVNRSGIKYRFGTQSTSTVTDGGTRIFGWNLTEQEDLHGNRIRYEYERDATGRPYLMRIVYNDSAPADRNEVLFEYEDRVDALTSYVSTFAVSTAKRVRRIVVQHGGAVVRSYGLSYADGDGISRLSQITMTGRDGATALPALRLDYAQLNTNAMAVVTMADGPARALGVTTELDDVDGDSLPDLLVMDPSLDGGTYSYYPNLDGDSFGTRIVMSNTPSVWLDSAGVQLADMDGDGASDVVARVSSAIDGFRFYPGGNTTGFGTAVTITPNPSAGFDDPNVRLVDLNHDRLTDWMRVDPTTGLVFVSYNSGAGAFTPAVSRPAIDASQVVSFEAGAKLTDCNGDGLTDVALFRSASFRCWAGRGHGYFASPTLATGVPMLPANEVSEVEVRDVNGDGLADLVHVGVSQVRLWLNRGGSAFQSPITIAGTPYRGPNTTTRLSDMNGNGSEDIVWIDPTSAAAAWRYLDVLAEGPPGLMTRIDNGLGKIVTIQYASLGTMRGWSRAEGVPISNRSSIGQTVVSSVVTDDSLGAPTETKFYYANAYYDARTREWRGFGTSRQREEGDVGQPTSITNAQYDVGRSDETLRGKAIRSEETNVGGSASRLVETTYEVVQVATSSVGPIYEAQSRSVTTTVTATGSPPSVTRIDYDHDNFGNVTRMVEWGFYDPTDPLFGSDERETITTYAVNASRWILDRRSEVTLRSGTGSGSTATQQRYFYDGDTNGALPLGEVTIGDLRRTESATEAGHFEVEESRDYDSFGNAVRIMRSAGSVTTLAYDPTHTFVVDESHEGGATVLHWHAERDPLTGAMLTITDPNGARMTFEYDVLDRITKIVEPYDSLDLPTRRFEYELGAPLSRIVETRATGGSTEAETTVVLVDGLSRERATFIGAGQVWLLDSGARYGKRGWSTGGVMPRRALAPTYEEASGSPLVLSREYDAFGRVVLEADAGGTRRERRYEPNRIVEYSEADLDPTSVDFDTPEHRFFDGLGREVSHAFVDRDGAIHEDLRVEVDARDAIVLRRDAAGNETRFGYDLRGRRVTTDDTNAGHMEFRYDVSNKRTFQKSPDGSVVRWRYDAFGRLVSVSTQMNENAPEVLVAENRYDGSEGEHDANTLGRRIFSRDALGEVRFSYDDRGRITSEERRLTNGSRYRHSTTFDSQDRATRRTFPDDTFVRFAYDVLGQLESVSDLISRVEWTERASVRVLQFGNGVRVDIGHDALERPRSIAASRSDGTVLLDRSYEFDATSRLTSIVDSLGDGQPSDATVEFGYDERDRVVSELRPSGTIGYNYDARGNLTSRTTTDAPGVAAVQLAYADDSRPSRPTSANGVQLDYDLAGRVIGDDKHRYSYDQLGRMSEILRTTDSARETVAYDASGAAASITHGAHGVVQIAPDLDVIDGRLVKYVVVGGRRVVRIGGESTASVIAGREREHSDQPAAAASASLSVRWNRARLLWWSALIAAILALGTLLRRRSILSPRRHVPRAWRLSPVLLATLLCSSCGSCGDAPTEIQGFPSNAEAIISDPFGSVIATIDSSAAVAALIDYSAYGERRNLVPGAGAYGYLGRSVSAVGDLVYLGARVYRPELGLFLSPDPAIVSSDGSDLADPDAVVPYLHSAGGPLSRPDASGRTRDQRIENQYDPRTSGMRHIQVARRYTGTMEGRDDATIIRFHRAAGTPNPTARLGVLRPFTRTSSPSEDVQAWCAAFVTTVLKESGHQVVGSPRTNFNPFRAREWRNWSGGTLLWATNSEGMRQNANHQDRQAGAGMQDAESLRRVLTDGSALGAVAVLETHPGHYHAGFIVGSGVDAQGRLYVDFHAGNQTPVSGPRPPLAAVDGYGDAYENVNSGRFYIDADTKVDAIIQVPAAAR